MEARKTYIRSFKKQPLHQVARTAPLVASLDSVANFRAVARVAPTPGEQAMRLADPRRPNSACNATPLRPSNWVATGSNRPTQHYSRMPPPPLPGASHAPPAGSTGTSERGANAASSEGTAGASAAAFDSQSVRDALLTAQRVIESCAPTSSPERSARPSATSRPATTATGASRNMQDRPAARRAAAAASPSTTPLSSATDAQHAASSATSPATPPASAKGAMAACPPSAVARAASLGASPQLAVSAPATASPRTVARVAPRPSPAHLVVRRQCAHGVLRLDRRLDRRLLAVVGHRLHQPLVVNLRWEPLRRLGAHLLYARMVRLLDIRAILCGNPRRMHLLRTSPLPCAHSRALHPHGEQFLGQTRVGRRWLVGGVVIRRHLA